MIVVSYAALNFSAIAAAMSASKPTTFPLSSSDSNGGYVVSEPKYIVPLLRIVSKVPPSVISARAGNVVDVFVVESSVYTTLPENHLL